MNVLSIGVEGNKDGHVGEWAGEVQVLTIDELASCGEQIREPAELPKAVVFDSTADIDARCVNSDMTFVAEG